jgi:hypothetical protein
MPGFPCQFIASGVGHSRDKAPPSQQVESAPVSSHAEAAASHAKRMRPVIDVFVPGFTSAVSHPVGHSALAGHRRQCQSLAHDAAGCVGSRLAVFAGSVTVPRD